MPEIEPAEGWVKLNGVTTPITAFDPEKPPKTLTPIEYQFAKHAEPWLNQRVLDGQFDLANADHLQILRYLALVSGQDSTVRKQNLMHLFPRMWLRFLMEQPPKSFYLRHVQARDSVFYRDFNDLRPKPRTDWLDGWAGKLECLDGIETDLTIAELEIALCIFDWDKDKEDPTLVWWFDLYPYLKEEIWTFLRRRYCWPLLDVFERAAARPPAVEQKTVKENTARVLTLKSLPRRAAAAIAANTRILALAFVGIFALANIDKTTVFFNNASTYWHIALGAAAVAVLRFLVRQDVRKQNHGLLQENSDHARPRVRGLLWRILLCGLVVSGLIAVAVKAYYVYGVEGVGQEQWTDFSYNKYFIIHAMSKVVSQGIAGALVGMLVQWLFDDVPLTEPV